MTREWKPGDVARFVGRGEDCLIFRYRPLDTDEDEWVSAEHGGAYPRDAEIRPLLVIDPEDREQVERLLSAIDECPMDSAGDDVTEMQAILRSMLGPKPDEPTGLGAVVRDRQDVLWVRARTEKHEWRRPTEADTPLIYRAWAEIDAVEILSDGVTA